MTVLRHNWSRDRQDETGCAVLRARAAHVSWKVLVALYGRSRIQLWRCAEGMKQKSATYETQKANNETQ
jgi:hypothetical protein